MDIKPEQIVADLEYAAYRNSRKVNPNIPPERYFALFRNWREFEDRYREEQLGPEVRETVERIRQMKPFTGAMEYLYNIGMAQDSHQELEDMLRTAYLRSRTDADKERQKAHEAYVDGLSDN